MTTSWGLYFLVSVSVNKGTIYFISVLKTIISLEQLRDTDYIVSSITQCDDPQKWCNQFTEEELTEMRDALDDELNYQTEEGIALNELETALYHYETERDLKRLKKIKWSKVEFKPKPIRDSHTIDLFIDGKHIGDLWSTSGCNYHLSIYNR